MSSPFGAPQGCCAKGQTDTPINRPNRGDVPEKGRIRKNIKRTDISSNPSPVSPKGEKPISLETKH